MEVLNILILSTKQCRLFNMVKRKRLVNLSSYLIIFVCGFKMIRFINLNSNFDNDLKRLNKLLIKVLIILAPVPFINDAGSFFLLIASTTQKILQLILCRYYLLFPFI
uniref:Uncharacterized protein n=1 Tax=Meloidogyne enterolobii TaxID=390850 RepID=A0A6V7TUS9_MELEN|nr:unnamed protein product [Meloidogyne enterolobii]